MACEEFETTRQGKQIIVKILLQKAWAHGHLQFIVPDPRWAVTLSPAQRPSPGVRNIIQPLAGAPHGEAAAEPAPGPTGSSQSQSSAQRSETAGQGKERRTGTTTACRCATPANQTQMQMQSACKHLRGVYISAGFHSWTVPASRARRISPGCSSSAAQCLSKALVSDPLSRLFPSSQASFHAYVKVLCYIVVEI